MPIPESKRRNNDIYNAKCDRISARPIKPIGNAIRAAAKAAGQSQPGHIAGGCTHLFQNIVQGRGTGTVLCGDVIAELKGRPLL